MHVRLLDPAAAEVEEAADYFDSQLSGLGSRFEHEVEAIIARIAEHPRIGSPLTKRVRKFRLRKFKYNVVYALKSDEILIIAVAHPKKRPWYWRYRLAGEL